MARVADDLRSPGPVVLDDLTETGWQRLVEQYRPRLERYARARGVTEPEDLAQDVLHALTEGSREFLGRPELEAWLFTVAFRRAADWHRYRYRHPTTTIEGIDRPSDAADPSASACETETITEVSRAMATLSERERTVLHLRIHAELDAATTGAVLGMSASHVRVVQTRALAKLRSRIPADRDLRSALGIPAMSWATGRWLRTPRFMETLLPGQSFAQGGLGMAVITATVLTVSIAAVDPPQTGGADSLGTAFTGSAVGDVEAVPPGGSTPDPSTVAAPDPPVTAPPQDNPAPSGSPPATTTPEPAPPDEEPSAPTDGPPTTVAAAQQAPDPPPTEGRVGLDLGVSGDAGLEAGVEAELAPVGSAAVSASVDGDGLSAEMEAEAVGVPVSAGVQAGGAGVTAEADVGGLTVAVSADSGPGTPLGVDAGGGDVEETVEEAVGEVENLVTSRIGALVDR